MECGLPLTQGAGVNPGREGKQRVKGAPGGPRPRVPGEASGTCWGPARHPVLLLGRGGLTPPSGNARAPGFPTPRTRRGPLTDAQGQGHSSGPAAETAGGPRPRVRAAWRTSAPRLPPGLTPPAAGPAPSATPQPPTRGTLDAGAGRGRASLHPSRPPPSARAPSPEGGTAAGTRRLVPIVC